MKDKSAHYQNLKDLYYASPSTSAQGKGNYEILSIEEGAVELRERVQPEMFNAAERMHGMYYFKLMDESAHLAASSEETDVVLVTTDFSMHFIRPVSEGWITAKGRLIGSNKSQIIAESHLYDEAGRLIGHGKGTFMRSKVRLDEKLKRKDS